EGGARPCAPPRSPRCGPLASIARAAGAAGATGTARGARARIAGTGTPAAFLTCRRHVFLPIDASVLVRVDLRELQALDRGQLRAAQLPVLVRIHFLE